MYYLVIDIHHFSQLAVIEPELAANILDAVHARCDKWGMREQRRHDYLVYLYDHPVFGEYEPVVNLLFELQELLAEYEEELHGYSLIFEAIDGAANFAPDKLSVLVRERSGLYLGPTAARLNSRFFAGKQYRGLWKVEGCKQQDDQNIEIAAHFILQQSFFENVFDQITPWINGLQSPGEAHIRGDEFRGAHLIGRSIIHRLTVAAAWEKTIYAIVEEEDDLLCAIVRSMNVRNLSWVEEQLTPLEQQLWEEKIAMLGAYCPFLAEGFPQVAIEKPEIDMLIVMQLYLRAYARWSRSQGGLPLIIFYLRRQLSDAEKRFIALLMKDGQKEAKLLWLFIARQEYLPNRAIALERISVTLPNYTKKEVNVLCGKYGLSDHESRYLRESTEYKGMAIYHFLSNKEFFIKMLPSRLRNYGGITIAPARGIILRSLNFLDMEVRELLYILMLIGLYLDKEQIFTFFESRGKSRVRITELYKELQSHGYLFYEHLNTVACRDEINELALNFTNTGLIKDGIRFILDPHNKVRLQSGLVQFIINHSKTKAFLPAIYRHIQMLINCRQYEKAREEQGRLQTISSGVFALIDARLSLEDNSFSERVIPLNFSGDDFWRAEWLIIQTLFCIKERRMEEAKKACKSAIILFQDIDDEYGLCQGNIIFGYLHHCFHRHQDAHHYFALGKKNRGTIGDSNLIFAEFMGCLSNFIQGRYSRVRRVMEGKGGLLRGLLQCGAYSWARAAAFLMARTYFALGMYEEAQILLGQQLNSLRGNVDAKMNAELDEQGEEGTYELFFAWIARCYVYRGMFRVGKAIMERLPQTRELTLFRAEAGILRNDFDDALLLLRDAEAEEDASYSFHLLFPWNHGFSWMEDLLVRNLTEDSSLINYRHGITAFIHGKLGNAKKSIERFHWLTKEKKLPHSDPHLSTILYWYFCILEQSRGQDHEDWLTLLGRAVKALQETASSIDDPVDKRSYLKAVIWNRELFNSAKKHNLL